MSANIKNEFERGKISLFLCLFCRSLISQIELHIFQEQTFYDRARPE